jgi:16S rRNA (uracil1498-N3)-methyltransferase
LSILSILFESLHGYKFTQMRRFYAPAESFSGQTIALGAEESKHLRDVLRLREGAEIFVFDGCGNEFRCRIESIKRGESVLEILERFSPRAPESALELTLAAALLKGEKFDLVIQKACEIGVTRIIPLETKRADVKLRDARETGKKLERWRRISLEAAKQSGRATLMQIEKPLEFSEFIKKASRADEVLLFFSERGGESFESLSTGDVSKITAVVGAEGGWEDSEIEAARGQGFQIITLGGRILRAETAAIVVSALVQNRFGDLR